MSILSFFSFGLLACGSETDTAHVHHEHMEHNGDSGAHLEHGDEGELNSFEVTGVVVDDEGTPVEDAWVMVGGESEDKVSTDFDGNFTLWYSETGYGQAAIVAAKVGYRAQGYEFFKPDTPISIRIRRIDPTDNVDYEFMDPGNGYDHMKEDCSHCHTGFVLDILSSGHAEATRNPFLQDLYAGVNDLLTTSEACSDAGGDWAMGLEPGDPESSRYKCYLGGGVLSDLNPNCGGVGQSKCDSPDALDSEKPTGFGACADCHAPGINGIAGDRNLHEAVGYAYEYGVHCDTCHKVRDIDLSQPPGVGKRLVMGRPSDPGQNTFVWDPVYYGPLIDVPNVAMGGSYQPKFNESQFCAGCHEQEQPALVPGEELDTDKWPNGLPVHSTFSEWEEGPYNQEATQCQFCHMPANTGRMNAVDISNIQNQSITFGFPREPEDIRQHLFRGPLSGEDRLIDDSIFVSLQTVVDAGELDVTVSLANVGCGHALPTGEPMRSLILVVTADSQCGELIPTGGMTINDIGGALGQGVEGTDTQSNGTSIEWPDAYAEPGLVLRVVRPSGEFDDYPGVGYFSEDGLLPEDKGLEILDPIGEAMVVSTEGDLLFLDQAIDIQNGDILYLAQDWLDPSLGDHDARYLAGMPGHTFSRVLVDSSGNRQVPHHKAVDMASDNRIPPATNVLSHHQFQIPDDCNEGSVTATVIYRPIPLNQAEVRGWDARDHIFSTEQAEW